MTFLCACVWPLCVHILFLHRREKRDRLWKDESVAQGAMDVYIYIFTVLHYRWMPLRVLRHPTANAPDNHFDGFASPTLSFLSVFKINIIYMLQYAVCGVLVLFPPFFLPYFYDAPDPTDSRDDGMILLYAQTFYIANCKLSSIFLSSFPSPE